MNERACRDPSGSRHVTATRRPGDASGARHTSPISPASGPVQGRYRPWTGPVSATPLPALAEVSPRRWQQLTRWTRRRDRLPDTYRATAGLVPDPTVTV